MNHCKQFITSFLLLEFKILIANYAVEFGRSEQLVSVFVARSGSGMFDERILESGRCVSIATGDDVATMRVAFVICLSCVTKPNGLPGPILLL